MNQPLGFSQWTDKTEIKANNQFSLDIPKVDVEKIKDKERKELFSYFPEHRRMKKREFNNMVNNMKMLKK